jgi:Helix-turn-helix domain
VSELGINIQSRAPSLRTQWQVAIGESDLPATTRLVAWALSTWMNSEGFCWPQQSEIARRAGVTDRTVRQALGACARPISWVGRPARVRVTRTTTRP